MPKRTNTFQKVNLWLQESLQRSDAKVTESALVQDFETNSTTEVDILVEFVQGGEKYHTGIECRDHRRAADVQWIRELATKRDSCRLNKMVAVHSRGFSKGARSLAEKRGISLLTLRDVPFNKANESIAARLFGKPLTSWSIHGIELHVQECENHSGAKGATITELFREDRTTSVDVLELVRPILSKNMPKGVAGLADGTYKDFEGRFPIPRGSYFAKIGDAFLEVVSFKANLRVFKSQAVLKPGAQQLVCIEGDRSVGEIVAHKIPGPGGVYTFGLTVDSSTKSPQYFVELPVGIDLKQLKSELTVTYRLPGSMEEKTVTIPGELVECDAHGNLMSK